MRNRPVNELEKKQEDFIKNATAKIADESNKKEDLHRYVKKGTWPLEESIPTPSLADGSSLKKPILLHLKENEWNSIDRHTKSLGVSKQEWIRHALYKLLEEEQMFFLAKENKNK